MKKIVIVKYNPRWPEIYNREKEKIIAAIGNRAQKIEHIGSTSVADLMAKPVVDIMVAIKSFSLTKKLIKPLRSIGYKYIPEYEVNIPERCFFHRGPSEYASGSPNCHFHLHIVEKDSSFWYNHLLFRDYLRRHKEALNEYGQLKKKLAIVSSGDVNKYCNGKSYFVKNALRLAKIENKKRNIVKIRKFRIDDTKQIAKLIVKVFCEQVSDGLSLQGQKNFCQHNTPERILALSKKADIFVAEITGRIIGIISGIDNNRIVRLFIDKKWQGHGIAKNLMNKIESLYKVRGAKAIHLRSSLYAQKFYIKMGYKKATRVIHDKHGMVYQPMIRKL